MTKIALPDCRHKADPFTLSPEDRRELVRRIAEKGAAAIDEFIKEREAAGDSGIAARIRKLREALLKQAEDLKRRLSGEFQAREDAIEAEYRARLAELQDRERALREDLSHLRAGEAAAFAAAIRQNPALGIALDADVVARPPWWRRVLAALAWVLRLLLAPIRWLFRRRAEEKTPDRLGMIVPTDRAGALYLADPTFRAAVRSRLRAAPPRVRIRRAWERLLGLEDYESLARKAMQQMMTEEQDRVRSEQERRAREIEQTLADVLEREREAAAERAGAGEALEREREAEARRIEEALRNAPETEIKEAIVDELVAAGLIRGETLVPTMQFIDRFAAMVYQEESARAGGAGATGEYAEGEGHYRREPLRSAVEVSRMDIPASLLRARSRRPRSRAVSPRHMTEDDVVIYREEREGLLQVVLIVDRSGSMEEHGRMDAAKRAALALHHAVKARNPRNRVDVLLMDTSLEKASLRDVWDAQPRGFTNTGAALRLARGLCERRGRTLVYLITDGLPEAYTKEGEDVAGHPEKAMAYAKEQARLLRRERGLEGFVMLLLEPKDELYTKAARALAEEAGGRVVPVDPGELAAKLLKEFEAPEAARPRA